MEKLIVHLCVKLKKVRNLNSNFKSSDRNLKLTNLL